MPEMQTTANGNGSSPHARSRKTRPSVRIIDQLTSFVITGGGILVIVCVLGILVYLGSVVAPLFSGATLSGQQSFPLPPASVASPVLFCAVDEYRALGACLESSGELRLYSARDGAPLAQRSLWPASEAPAAFQREPASGAVALGLGDGRLRLGHVRFTSAFLEGAAVEAAGHLAPGAWMPWPDGLIERTPGGDLRHLTVEAGFDEPQELASPPAAIVALDYRPAEASARIAVLLGDRRMLRVDVGGERNFLTGEVESAIKVWPLPEVRAGAELPGYLRINSRGDELYVAWRSGEVLRYDLRDPAAPAMIERADLVAGSGLQLTVFEWTLGERSLLCGDSSGALHSWSRVPVAAGAEAGPEPVPADGFALRRSHDFGGEGAPVTVVASSQRDKTFAVGHGDGRVRLHHLSSEQLLATTRVESGDRIERLQITPKGDGLVAFTAGAHATIWELRNPHPETTLRSLFGPVWYEGFAGPEHVWQSSSGTDDFEPKLGLVPLVFGTLKATLYSMLLAVPIALGAAIYTSEFLDSKFRGPVKTTIELMASLPSVVLGFLAALVLAPLVEQSVLAILTAFGLLPVVALGFGYLLQIAPPELTFRLRGRIQFVILFALLAATAALASPLAGLLESWLFVGDFKGWLAGQHGSGRAGLAILLWPVALAVLLALDRWILVPSIGRRAYRRRTVVLLEAGKFVTILAASIGLAALLAWVGFGVGVDPRGSLLATYVQRNALVVGFAMGFAVIPIIYTLSEDALSSVPQSLRSASLGCGATRWQTATRIVLPVALPGIFSALMVGLGRAVGETMIVLMAAGNTPVLDLNIFGGLRTLSANIAVELPEAVKDGTLYRVLFLAALTLFLLTFVFNTAAEIIRQRLRRRTAQL